MDRLPTLIYEDFIATRDYLREVAMSIGALQRLFIAPDSRDWSYGLEPVASGLQTQVFVIAGQAHQLRIDISAGALIAGEARWNFTDYSSTELHKNLQLWLQAHSVQQLLPAPKFSTTATVFDSLQAENLLGAFNWLRRQFAVIKAETEHGLTSPLLVYPHHFDLSLVWFPQAESETSETTKQLSLGFSTGDETISEPYIYSAAYPQLDELPSLQLPAPAYWQKQGFTGAVLRYQDLANAANAPLLLHSFGHGVWNEAERLLAG